MKHRILLTLSLCGILAGCADASKEPEPPANSEQLPVPPDPSGGTAGQGEGAQDPAVTPGSTSQPATAAPAVPDTAAH